MVTLSPNQIGLLVVRYMGGHIPPGGIWVVNDSGHKIPPDPKAKAATIAFLDDAIAVCLGESSGNPASKNVYKGMTMAGLWQINTTAHADKIPPVIKWITSETQTSLTLNIYDPRVNTAVAQEVYAGAHGWSPWQAYTDKSRGFKAGKGHGAKVYQWLNSQKNIDAAWDALMSDKIMAKNYADLAAIINPFAIIGAVVPDSISGAIDGLLSKLKEAGVAIGAFLIGLLLLILGAWFIASQTKTGKAAIHTAKRAATAVATDGGSEIIK